MHGPYSSSSCPYHLSQSLHWWRIGSCAWRSLGFSYIPRDMVRLTERIGFRPAESAFRQHTEAVVHSTTDARVSAFSHLPLTGTSPQRGGVPCVFTSERYRRLSAILTRKYDLTPNADLGWLVGVILGDGYIWRMQSGGYVIGLDTPEVFYADLFGGTLAKRFPGLWVKRYFRRRNRIFNGKKFVEDVYTIRAVSKFLYDFPRPHKQHDFHWTIPSSIHRSRACMRGFLQGIFDAEGGLHSSRPRICLTSK